MIYQELIHLDMEVQSVEEYFNKMAEKLVLLGYVENSFLEAVKTREKKFPTALPIKPFSVAIPHTDPLHIKKPFIAATRLRSPVKWKEMGNNEIEQDVKFVFMLGLHREDDHIKLLQLLIDNFQREDLMDRFSNAETKEEYMKLILSIDGLEDDLGMKII